jgi:hypothetical protein
VSRLARFEAYRYVGTRDTMLFYDCDDEEQFAELKARVEEESLLAINTLQAFAPDTPLEAMNRSFKPVSPSKPG